MTVNFRYRAAGADGRLVEGNITSPSRHEVMDDLRRRQLFPVDVVEVADAHQTRATRLGMGNALAAWTRTVATLLSAGVTLEKALVFSSSSAYNEKLSVAIAGIQSELRGGSSLAAAMRKQSGIFSPVYIAMISAGEESGALDKVLGRLADDLDEAAELRARFMSSLLYPVLMAIVAAAGVIVILLFVVPRFAEMLAESGGSLPLSTRTLVFVSELVIRWWWIWIPSVVALVYGIRMWLSIPRNRKRWHGLRLNLPLSGQLELNYATARFARTLGLLLQSGVPLLPSLRIARSGMTNEIFGDGIDRAALAVGQGKRLSSELSGIVPTFAAQLFSVGEESGRLDELSLRVAQTYDREVSLRMRTLIGVVEPVLILVFGLIVGFVALAMLQAIYSVNARVL